MRIVGHTAAEIAASLERQLHAGGTATGDTLPPVRQLAGRLRVSPATVAAAYKLLRARGLVAGRGRRGTRVVPGSPTAPVARRAALPPGTVDLATGNPDPAFLPPLESALRMAGSTHVLYGAAGPDRGLLAFAAAEFEADGIAARALAVVSGALDGIERVLREYLRVGDHVAVEDPSFPGILDLISASGWVPAPVAIDDAGLVPRALEEALRRGCRAVIVTPRAQNPTGAAITAERAEQLRRTLRRFSGVVVIENDYAGPVAGTPARTVRGGGEAPWAVIRSTSKFLGPDLRVALLAGDEVTVARVSGRQALGARWVSHLLQRLALALWSDPSNGRRFARAAETYATCRSALRAALADRGIPSRGQSGFNVWVPVANESQVVRALADRGWAVAPGERFRLRSEPAIRITTATLEPADAERLAGDLADALRPRSAALA
ncbi:MAG: aminotransferase class I/II-fold pyridoxal phosphate-dependent enzyme [Acidobacteria bacterium]|nr:aminotransferase class I/II-fold pyridoxal phosphate-dependent enzyme [Acidobacteriota bacterium]